MDYDFIIAWCPFCKQGFVQIRKDSGDRKLFVMCAECETIWKDPIDVQLNKPVIEYALEGYAIKPSLNEVEQSGWVNFVKNTFEVG